MTAYDADTVDPSEISTPAALWRSAAGFLSPRLADDTRRAWLTDALPTELRTRHLLLECDPAHERLDFSILPAEIPSNGPHALAFGAKLERIKANATWIAGAGAPAPFRARSWLEYDVRGPGHRLPPSGFVTVPGEIGHDRDAIARLAAFLAAEDDRTAAESEVTRWRSVLDHELAPFWQAQPPPAVRYLSRMEARGEAMLRVQVAPVQVATLRQWRSWPEELAPILAAADLVAVAIDVGLSRVGARWGLELVCHYPTRLGGRYRPLLDELSRAGLLPSSLSGDIAAWTGASRDPAAGEDWRPALLRGSGAWYHVRTLNHIKVVLAAGSMPSAKVYLSVDQRWIGAAGG